MRFGRAASSLVVPVALGLCLLGGIGLGLRQVQGDGPEDLRGMIAQGLLVQRFSLVDDCRGEFVPGQQDLLGVRLQKF